MKYEYQYRVETIDRWKYKVTVYQDTVFIGKAITNDPQAAVRHIVEDHEKVQ